MERSTEAILKNESWWCRSDLHYHEGQLRMQGCVLETLPENFQHPVYVYGLDRVHANIDRMQAALQQAHPATDLYYAMKANRISVTATGLSGSEWDSILSHPDIQVNAGFNVHPEPVFYALPLHPLPLKEPTAAGDRSSK
jgi:hypothetical protein